MKITDIGEYEILLGFIGNISTQNLLLILLIVLLLFGAKKLPDLAKGLGNGLREFKKATKEIGDDAKATSVSEPSSAEKPVDGDKASA